MKLFVYSLLIFFQFAFGQRKELIVLDANTKAPIADVNVYSPETSEGTFSNSDGKLVINLKENMNLKVSNFNYQEQLVPFKDLKALDTIYLLPKINELDEVVINSFNLKKALQYVLDNYSSLYVDVPFEKECVFKETMELDGQLKRLIMSKVNWWDKSYERKKDNIKLRLGAIDYNKNISSSIFYDAPKYNKLSSGSITPKSIINSMYLNIMLPGLISNIQNVSSKVVTSTKETIIVSFEIEKETYKTREQIIFDKKTKGIIQYSNIVEMTNKIDTQLVEESNKIRKLETTKSSLSVVYGKSLNDKLTLKIYEINAEAILTYDNKSHNVLMSNKINVLNEANVKKVNNTGLIDLEKPIYKSLPSEEIKSSNEILLTQKEKDFINAQ